MDLSPHTANEMNGEKSDAIVDQLRSCRTAEQLLALDEQIRVETATEPLYRVICSFLRDRTVAPVEAALWLATLMDHRERQLDDCLHLHCQL